MLNGPMLFLAEAAAPQSPAPRGPFDYSFLIFLAVIFGIMYCLILRPQKKKEQQRKEMLSKVERGNRVVTIGGLYGEVQTVKEEFVILLVDPERGTTLKFRRSAVHEILPQGSVEEEK